MRCGRVTARQRLPVLPVPLRQPEASAALDLQALVDRAYTAGRYDDLNYTAELDPPLRSEDAPWTAELLKAAAKR